MGCDPSNPFGRSDGKSRADAAHVLARGLLMRPPMMNLPPFGPLATAGAPLQSTIVVIGAPLVMAAALVLGIGVLVLCVVALRARGASRPAAASSCPSPGKVPMLYATGGER